MRRLWRSGCGWGEGSNLQQEELWDARLDTLKRRIRKIRAMSEGRHSGSLGVVVSFYPSAPISIVWISPMLVLV